MVTRTTKDWKTGVETVESLFVGATLAVHRNSTRVMSDVWEYLPYATVFNAATGKVEVVWHDGKNATVDATAEAVAGANTWLLTAATEVRKNRWAGRVAEAVAEAKNPSKGKTVVVTKGRKVAKGTTGEVFWVGAGRSYSYYDRNPANRLGIRDAAGTVHWTAASNVEVVNPDDYFDYDEWVANEPNHAADALTALNAGRGYSEVVLHAGEDRLGFNNWFSVADAAKEAA